MELFSYYVNGVREIDTYMADFKAKCPENPSSILALVFTSYDDAATIGDFTRHLSSAMPGMVIAGCTTGAEIRAGGYIESSTVVVFLVFEHSMVKTEILDCGLFSNDKIAKTLMTTAVLTPDIKGVQLLMTLKSSSSMKPFFDKFSQIFHNIEIFGGSADSSFSIWPRAGQEFTYVFTDEMISEDAVLAIYFSGADLHLHTDSYLGWIPLGREHIVTEVEDDVMVKTIDNEPAAALYNKYIGVNKSEMTFESLLAFPYMLERHGRHIARSPLRVYPDLSLKFAADICVGETVRLAYGDPSAMLRGAKKGCEAMEKFAPQAILLFSCISRLMYLHDEVNRELSLYQAIAPTAGLYTYGEIQRFPEHKNIELLNSVLLSVGFREGEPVKKSEEQSKVYNASTGFSDERLSLVRGLAHFVSVTSKELEEATEKLKRLANEDRLTEITNRGAIEEEFAKQLNALVDGQKIAVIILDIDDFKKVNDTFGHEVGDDVLKYVAKTLKASVRTQSTNRQRDYFGRWGGEEFLVILPHQNAAAGVLVAERIRKNLASTKILPDGRNITASLGVAVGRAGDKLETVYQKCDGALYYAKEHGKNQVRLAEGSMDSPHEMPSPA